MPHMKLKTDSISVLASSAVVFGYTNYRKQFDLFSEVFLSQDTIDTSLNG